MQHSADISRLVEEVEKTGMPSKRNLLIHPRMSAQVYHCSLYAVLPMDRIGTILGVIIHESWPKGESAAGSDGPADLSRQPSDSSVGSSFMEDQEISPPAEARAGLLGEPRGGNLTRIQEQDFRCVDPRGIGRPGGEAAPSVVPEVHSLELQLPDDDIPFDSDSRSQPGRQRGGGSGSSRPAMVSAELTGAPEAEGRL